MIKQCPACERNVQAYETKVGEASLLCKRHQDELNSKLGNIIDSTKVEDVWKKFNDTFEYEIESQEFAIDEAEWNGLIKALKVAQTEATQALTRLITESKIELLKEVEELPELQSEWEGGDGMIRNELRTQTIKSIKELGEE